jgi:two-component system, OmpR family, KDP operon response regulator KdpE
MTAAAHQPSFTVLVIDDEPPIRKFLRIGLQSQGYRIIDAGGAQEGITRCADTSPDLVILDLGLPDGDGLDVIAEVRTWSRVPILVLSVRASEEEKVEALDRGASDFVTKPFGMAELLARVRALLRDRPREGSETAVCSVGPLIVDVARHKVTLDGVSVRLSRKEFDLLRLLVTNAGRLLTHKQLLREIWGRAHENDTQYLRVYIGQLRSKLGDDPTHPRFIANEPGIGYRMLTPNRR